MGDVIHHGRKIAHVAIAETHVARAKGLLGKRHLEAHEGLWITPCAGVHTWFMRFAIDVVGMDREQRVVRVWHGLKPWRMTRISPRMRSVLELRAGQIAARNIQVGDLIEVKRGPAPTPAAHA